MSVCKSCNEPYPDVCESCREAQLESEVAERFGAHMRAVESGDAECEHHWLCLSTRAQIIEAVTASMPKIGGGTVMRWCRYEKLGQ